MGTVLTRAAQWTTAGTGTGKLALTPLNESLLVDIITFVENIGSKHPQETTLVFREPLKWTTDLDPSAFGSGYEISENTVKSEQTDKDGQPLLLLSSSVIEVYNFAQLSNVLFVAKDKKLKEVQKCLEANRDPIAKILGPRFATVAGMNTSIHMIERINKDEKDPEVELQFKMFLLIQELDMQLLNSSLIQMSRDFRLTPEAVKNDVVLFKQISGKEEYTPLKSIDYTSDYEFSNGCRAPPWRQIHGEICYLIIEPHDVRTLFVTCSTAGVFLNGGIEKNGAIDYERESEIFKDLTTLLKLKSPHFAEAITKDFFLKEEPPLTQCIQDVEPVAEVSSEIQKSRDVRDMSVHEKKKDSENKVLAAGGTASTIKEAEISFKWKPLGLMGPKYDSMETKEGKGLKREIIRKSPENRRQSALKLMKIPATGRDDTSDSSSDSEEDEEQPERRQEGNTDLPSEYWQIQKVVKYLKVGNQTATDIVAS
nr:PREDICTED: armadillo repeat-containing protein 4-like [Latimeria chalumnae]|eukprot:XP_014351097.1 PREDICTED: armadillo repeat-containing protein 4-like [Latimeria chalumnae]